MLDPGSFKHGWNSVRVAEPELEEVMNQLQSLFVKMEAVKVVAADGLFFLLFPWQM